MKEPQIHMPTNRNLPAQQGSDVIERKLPRDPVAAARAVAALDKHPDWELLGLYWTPDGSTQLVRYRPVGHGQTVYTRPIARPEPARKSNRGLLIAASVGSSVLLALCGGGYLWARSLSPGDVALTIGCIVGLLAIGWAFRPRGGTPRQGGTFEGTFKGTWK